MLEPNLSINSQTQFLLGHIGLEQLFPCFVESLPNLVEKKEMMKRIAPDKIGMQVILKFKVK